MHVLIFTYRFFYMKKNAIITVVVLALVRPPPVRVCLVVFDPVGDISWQGFFNECVLAGRLKSR